MRTKKAKKTPNAAKPAKGRKPVKDAKPTKAAKPAEEEKPAAKKAAPKKARKAKKGGRSRNFLRIVKEDTFGTTPSKSCTRAVHVKFCPICHRPTAEERKAMSDPSAKITQNNVTRPKQGTVTGNIWAIADALAGELQRPPEKDELIKRCEASGINAATVPTQFTHWRRFYGLPVAARASRKSAAEGGTIRVAKRPGEGTAGFLIWQTADNTSSVLNRPITREELQASALLNAIPSGTVASQYSQWRRFYGLPSLPRGKAAAKAAPVAPQAAAAPMQTTIPVVDMSAQAAPVVTPAQPAAEVPPAPAPKGRPNAESSAGKVWAAADAASSRLMRFCTKDELRAQLAVSGATLADVVINIQYAAWLRFYGQEPQKKGKPAVVTAASDVTVS